MLNFLAGNPPIRIPFADEMKGLLAFLVIVLGLVMFAKKRFDKRGSKRRPPEKRPPLVLVPGSSTLTQFPLVPPSAYLATGWMLTKLEATFFLILCRIVEPEYRIFTKVRLADLVRPNFPKGSSEWYSAFNQATQKHADFVICEADGVRILGVIELDDATHSGREAQRRDAVKDHVLGSAGVPLVRIPVAREYDPADVEAQLSPILGSRRGNPSPCPVAGKL